MVDSRLLIVTFADQQLKYDINERARARDLIDHPWLDGILVPAEIDELHRLAQAEEDAEAAAAVAANHSSTDDSRKD
jgi:hypothetical protein